MANDDFRWANGKISPLALNANSDYLIENFTRTDDMPASMDWYDPTDESDIFVDFGDMVDALDDTRGTSGSGEFTWSFPLLMPGQIEWLWINKFQREYSQLFTVQTPDLTREDAWRVVWCTGLWFDPRTDAKKMGTGLSEVKFTFIKPTTRPYGSMFTSHFTTEFK